MPLLPRLENPHLPLLVSLLINLARDPHFPQDEPLFHNLENPLLSLLVPPFLENSPVPSGCAPFAPKLENPPLRFARLIMVGNTNAEREEGRHPYMTSSVRSSLPQNIRATDEKKDSQKIEKRSTILYFPGCNKSYGL